MKPTLILLTALLLAPAALHAAEVPHTEPINRMLFSQPELAGFGNRMHVHARVPSGKYAMALAPLALAIRR